VHSADDRDPSLRRLFMVMGVVTAALIAAVIYTKVIRPPADRPINVAEMRSIDRVCDTRCGTLMRQMADETPDDASLKVRVKQCLADCRRKISGGRLVPTPERR
jgi:hypothetical protein